MLSRPSFSAGLTPKRPLMNTQLRMRRRTSSLELGRLPDIKETPRVLVPPVKPLLPYFKFSEKALENLKAHNPYAKSWELGRVAAKLWRDLPEAEKKPYFDRYEAERAEYEWALRNYHNATGSLYQGQPTKSGRVYQESPYTVTRALDVVEHDDLDFYDYSYPIKYASYVRFMRNQQLITAIFSDFTVPPPTPPNLEARLQHLKGQSVDLEKALGTLKGEVETLKTYYQNRKRRYAALDNTFQDKLKRFKI